MTQEMPISYIKVKFIVLLKRKVLQLVKVSLIYIHCWSESDLQQDNHTCSTPVLQRKVTPGMIILLQLTFSSTVNIFNLQTG